jgi:predicted dehydrogenase
MDVVRIGVVGVGHLGRHHARILSGMPHVSLVGVADVNAARAQDVASQYGGIAVGCARDLLDRVDAITIAVPTEVHAEVASHFVGRGIATLVEKPLAPSLDDANRMVALAEEHGALLATGHTERFNPAVVEAFRVIARPRFVEARRLSRLPDRSLDIDVVFDLMIHDLELLLALVDSPVTAVEAVGAAVLTDKTDLANARIRFASGCVATLTASRVSQEGERTFKVFQADACVSVDCSARTVEVFRLVRENGTRSIQSESLRVPDEEPLRCELENFVDAVRHRCAARVTGRAGRDAIALAARIAEQIERSAP